MFVLVCDSVFSLLGAVADNLARFGGLTSLNDVVEEDWDEHTAKRTSAIHFLEDGEDDDEEDQVR